MLTERKALCFVPSCAAPVGRRRVMTGGGEGSGLGTGIGGDGSVNGGGRDGLVALPEACREVELAEVPVLA